MVARPEDALTAPSRSDAIVRGASGLVGGPAGRHARFGGGSFWTPVRVLIAMVMLTFTAGVGMKLPCAFHGWDDHYQYTRLCYSDIYALYNEERLNEGAVPYVDHPVEYPVLTGGVMWAAAQAADDNRDFYLATAALLLVAAVVTVVVSAQMAGRRRVWDAALIALAPGLVLHGTTNWDLVAVSLAAVGMWTWSRRLPALSGLWFGLAIAAKFYPGVILVGLFFLCLRARRLGAWLQAAAVAAVTTALVYVPVMLASGSFPVDSCRDDGTSVTVVQPAWQRFFTLNRCRGADWDSWSFAVNHWFHTDLRPPRLNLIVTVLGAGVVISVGMLVWLAPRRPRVAQVVFLLVAGLLLVNKVNSPQFTLWLIPLAALARPRWGAFLAWQLAEVTVLFTRFYYFVNVADSGKGVPVQWFLRAIILRDALLLLLMALVVRDVVQPFHDVVRRDGEDDPAGGVLDGAIDGGDRAGGAWLPAHG